MYGKLFAQMFDGTLGTNGPWQALVTFQQLIILANKNGEVDITLGALSRRTTIPESILEVGIRELLKPDSGSRSPAEQGRRIVPVDPNRDWGWRLVNYDHYRRIRTEEDRREYHRQYAIKRRAARKSTKVNTSTAVNQKQPIAEVEVDVKVRSKALVQPGAARFAEFWGSYPVKKGRKAAEKSWRAKGCDAFADQLMAHVSRMLAQDDDWRRGYIPHGSTYLSEERWNDEPTGPKLAGSSKQGGGMIGLQQIIEGCDYGTDSAGLVYEGNNGGTTGALLPRS